MGFEELKSKCTWSWTGSGCKVTGPNGNSIVLPALGYRFCDECDNSYVGARGYYWSLSSNGTVHTWSLYFDSSGVDLKCGLWDSGYSVRLVQSK